MFGNIPEFVTVVCIASAITLLWMSVTQWSRFVSHQKANQNSSDEARDLASRFAFVPYFCIPLLGVIASVFCGLALGDLLGAHNVVTGAQEIGVVCVGASVIIFMAIDKYWLHDFEDSTYYDWIESEVLKSADTAAEGIDSEDLKTLKKLVAAFKKE